MDVQFARHTDPEDPDLYSFEGSKADLTDAVRDALLLELPYRFLCSEDCKGLVPQLRRQSESGYLHMPGGRQGYEPLFGIESDRAK